LTEQEVLIDIRERLVRVETKLDNQNVLSKKVDALEIKASETESRSRSNTHRIDRLESNNTRLWLTVIGAIVSAGIAAFIKLLGGD